MELTDADWKDVRISRSGFCGAGCAGSDALVPIWQASAAKVIGWKGFVSIGLAIALLAAWLLHKHDVGTIENLRNKNAQTEARLTISNQSIAELQSDLAAKPAESLARAAALTASEIFC